jgi:hypothetical protein
MTPELEREFRAVGVANFANKPCSGADILKLVALASQEEVLPVPATPTTLLKGTQPQSRWHAMNF